MSIPRYPAYVASGVDWLGNIPAGWNIKPLKHVADFINGDAFKPSEWADTGIPIIRIQNLNGSEEFNYFEGEIQQRYLVHDNDLLFGWSGNRGTSFGPFIWRRKEVCALNQHIFRAVPYSMDRSELYWVLKAVTAHVEDQAHGIIGMVHITKGDLGAINIPVPSSAEQKAIALFLDYEAAKIDTLVEEQRCLIELLKEKRQAVISQSVTKGLNPNVPMKDSGVDWLGQVPMHWDVTALKRLCSTITDGAHISPETDGGIFPFISTKDVADDRIDFDDCLRTSKESFALMVRTGCRPHVGDVLFSKDGTIGRTVVVREDRDFVVASSLIIIRPTQTALLSEYLNVLCQSNVVSRQVDGFVKGAGLPRLSIQNLRKVIGVFPPIEEQHEIATFVSEVSKRFDALGLAARETMSLLQERRAALISAAVTGKIDVRGLIPQQEAVAA